MQLKAATARAGQRFAPPPEALARLTAAVATEEDRTPLFVSPCRLGCAGGGPRVGRVAYRLAPNSSIQCSLRRTARPAPCNAFQWSFAAGYFDGSSYGQAVVSRQVPLRLICPTDVLPADTTLKGANLTYLDDQPAALLLFTIHKHEVSVFLTQRAGSPVPTTLPGARAGFTIHTASTPDLRMVAVSDVNPADLDLLVATLSQAQSQ